MKINKIVKIGIKEVFNNTCVNIDFKEDNTPYLSFYEINSLEKIPIPLQIDKVINIIKEHPFNNGISLGSYTLIQNNADEIVDIVKYNSPEYKKYFANTIIKPSSLKQGTIVKLSDDETLVFLKQFNAMHYYRLISLISDIKERNSSRKDDLINLKRNIIDYRFLECEPSLYNIFYSLENNKLKIYNSTTKSKKIVEITGSSDVLENINVRIMLKDFEESFLEDVINFEKFEFHPINNSLKYNTIKKSLVFFSSKSEITKFKNNILNYIEEIDKI